MVKNWYADTITYTFELKSWVESTILVFEIMSSTHDFSSKNLPFIYLWTVEQES